MVTSAAQADVIRMDLHRQGLTGVHLWLEPEASNTAPAVALAAALMGPEPRTDIMAVFPADHFIGDTAAFHRALEHGAAHSPGRLPGYLRHHPDPPRHRLWLYQGRRTPGGRRLQGPELHGKTRSPPGPGLYPGEKLLLEQRHLHLPPGRVFKGPGQPSPRTLPRPSGHNSGLPPGSAGRGLPGPPQYFPGPRHHGKGRQRGGGAGGHGLERRGHLERRPRPGAAG